MDLLERARALAACPLFTDLAPAVVIRLAERARFEALEPGERVRTDDTVWFVVDGLLAISSHAVDGPTSRNHGNVEPRQVLGLVRVVAPQTCLLEAIAVAPSVVVGVTVDDMRDVLEEDSIALAALSDALARLLVHEAAT